MNPTTIRIIMTACLIFSILLDVLPFIKALITRRKDDSFKPSYSVFFEELITYGFLLAFTISGSFADLYYEIEDYLFVDQELTGLVFLAAIFIVRLCIKYLVMAAGLFLKKDKPSFVDFIYEVLWSLAFYIAAVFCIIILVADNYLWLILPGLFAYFLLIVGIFCEIEKMVRTNLLLLFGRMTLYAIVAVGVLVLARETIFSHDISASMGLHYETSICMNFLGLCIMLFPVFQLLQFLEEKILEKYTSADNDKSEQPETL